jgi:hypothetical protein
MNGVQCPVGRRTRRALDSVLGLQKDRAGFEPGLCARSHLALDANTRTARLKPGAIASGSHAAPWARRGFRPTVP